MNNEALQGASFGTVASLMTIMGLLLTLYKSKAKKNIIIISLLSLTIGHALADGFSIYMSKNIVSNNEKNAYTAGLYTTLFAGITPLIFVIPYYILNVKWATYSNLLMCLCIILYISTQSALNNNLSLNDVIINNIKHIVVITIILGIGYKIGDYQ